MILMIPVILTIIFSMKRSQKGDPTEIINHPEESLTILAILIRSPSNNPSGFFFFFFVSYGRSFNDSLPPG